MSTRRYESELRARQAEQTRLSILDALVEVMAEGPTAVTVPAVADKAGVSVPTVYRHFGDKAGLLAAMVTHVGDRIGLRSLDPPEDLDALEAAIRQLFRHLDRADPMIRAALASGANPEARRSTVDLRMSTFRDVIDGFGTFDPADVERMARVILILTCSDALRLWHDRFDLEVDEVADHVVWAIRRLIEGSER